jgi:hypothetical protein
LFEDNGRPADTLPLQIHGYLDAVGDFDERDAAVHSVLLSVEGHDSVD